MGACLTKVEFDSVQRKVLLVQGVQGSKHAVGQEKMGGGLRV